MSIDYPGNIVLDCTHIEAGGGFLMPDSQSCFDPAKRNMEDSTHCLSSTGALFNQWTTLATEEPRLSGKIKIAEDTRPVRPIRVERNGWALTDASALDAMIPKRK